MRQIAIVTLRVAIDLLGIPEEREAIIADTLTSVLTENMQLFNGDRGNLVDWELFPFPPEANIERVYIDNAADYIEGSAFVKE